MFYKYRISDVISIKPRMFKEGIERAAYKQLLEKYVGIYDKDLGYILMISDPEVDPLGKIIAEDGSSNHRVEFYAYAYKPVKGEIVEGEVVGIENFGIFVRVGPVDALVHKSVLMDDVVDINKIEGVVIGRNTRETIRKGDIVRARVLDYSPPKGLSLMKIALYMKSPYLGKIETIEKNISKKEGGNGGEKERS